QNTPKFHALYELTALENLKVPRAPNFFALVRWKPHLSRGFVNHCELHGNAANGRSLSRSINKRNLENSSHMRRHRPIVLFVFQIVAVLSLGLSAFAQTTPRLSASTCAAPASSKSSSEPYTTTFGITVNSGDTVLSVVDGYRAVGKTISSVAFN